MNKRKAVALLGLVLLGVLLISCMQSSLRVANDPKTLHGRTGATAEDDHSPIAGGTPTPRSGGNHELPVSAGAPSGSEAGDDHAAEH